MATQPRERQAVAPAPAPSQIPTARLLTPGEFNTALVHLYRGEISRANTWRTRLDGTTNWAVLTTGTTLSFAFSSTDNSHVMILLNSLLIAFFLFIEARRYRYYDLWRARIRLMETEFFADLLVPKQFNPDNTHWRDLLSAELLQPHYNISLWEAMGRRLRRNYGWIFGVLVISWIVKVAITPFPTTNLAIFVERAAIGQIPGTIVIATGFIFNGLLILLGLATSSLLDRRNREEIISADANVAGTERNWWE